MFRKAADVRRHFMDFLALPAVVGTACVLAAPGHAVADPAPPFTGIVHERTFGSLSDYSQGIQFDVSAADDVYVPVVVPGVAANTPDRIDVFSKTGTFLRSIATNCTGLPKVELFGANEILVACSHVPFAEAFAVHRYSTTGGFLATMVPNGSGAGQVSNVAEMFEAPSGNYYVLDQQRGKMLVYDSSGTFVREWGEAGTGPGQIPTNNGNAGFWVDHAERVHVSNNALRADTFTSTGLFLGFRPLPGIPSSFRAGVIVTGALVDADSLVPIAPVPSLPGLSGPISAVFAPRGDRLFAVFLENPITPVGRVAVFRLGYRTGSSLLMNIPAPEIEVANISPRSGSAVLDIDYKVIDGDSATVSVHALALVGGTRDLTAARRMTTFVEGTASAIGSSVVPGAIRRVSWDAGADVPDPGTTIDAKLLFMAKDARGLLDIHFVTLPANVPTSGDPLLKISSFPIDDAELLEVWFWLVASGDTAVQFTNGQVIGTGAFAGQVLATGTTTTTEGRAYLWSRLGVRDATQTEIDRARAGTTPGVQVYDPLKRIGGRPVSVNEVGIDTGAATGYWVVRL